MSGMAAIRDVGAFFAAVFAMDHGAATAGGAGDDTPINGVGIDLHALADRPLSGAFVVPVESTLGATETVTVDAKVQDSANGSDWADYTYDQAGEGVAPTAQLILTGGGGGTTERGVIKLDVDLSAARRHIRCVVTPDLSAATTDTADVGGGIFLAGGGRSFPAKA